MTRDEAIENLQRLQNLLSNDPYINTQTIITTCNVAIEALKQEPCGDAISRQEALKLFATNDGKYLYEAIRDLPSVTPIPCSDAISRQAVMRILDEIGSDFDSPRDAVVSLDGIADAVQGLPSVTPNQRAGKWQEVYAETDYRNGWIEFSCENCEYQHGLESGEYGWSYGDPIPWKYCPICGARMVDPQESEG